MKRYSYENVAKPWSGTADGGGYVIHLKEDPNGDYVRFEDYENECARLQQELDQVRKERDALFEGNLVGYQPKSLGFPKDEVKLPPKKP